MAEHSRSGDATAKDEFATSEHEFLEKLNAQESSETRERLDVMGEHGGRETSLSRSNAAETASRMVGEIEGFARRQPLGALLGAFVAGLVLGLVARR